MNSLGKNRRSAKIAGVPTFKFPSNFIWGAATSAGQIEGAAFVDGRGASIWDEYFNARPHLDPISVACDHYNRMPEDVQLMKEMGLNAYRFSTSWSRVLTEGAGRVNEKGLDFYDRLVDTLLKNGIEPFLTLYHWDLPQRLQTIGGWLNRETGDYFADYAAVMAKRLGDRVKSWTTFNELEVIVAGSIGTGLAPALNQPDTGVQTGHNLLVAHGKALQTIKNIDPALKVGIVLNLVPVDPVDATPEAARAASDLWDTSYGWYLDALYKGHYPDAIYEGKGHGRLSTKAGDMALIGSKIDFMGVNYYLRLVVDGQGAVCPVPGADVTQMGWEIRPESLSKMLIELNQKYKLPDLFITENGAALDDTVVDGRIHDLGRINFLRSHLQALEDAASAGVKICGYFPWSFMDNLEWSLGFSKTFGLVHVDRQTLTRTVKDSGLWYRDVINAHGRSRHRRRV
ncbi:MAG: GH1 family beta-glucosidase [Candidatus Obscuribacterales bacterium]|nr:GH1 family beta-glucosidase [Candidatus Obscuribacterales bacterium]